VISDVLDTRVLTRGRSATGHPLHRPRVDISLTAFGQDLLLELELFTDLIHPDYHVIYGGPEDPTADVAYGLEHCFYRGRVNGMENSWLAVHTCGGAMEGVVYLGPDGVPVNPGDKDAGDEGLSLHITSTKTRSQRAAGEPAQHLVYRSQDIAGEKPVFECGAGDDHNLHATSDAHSQAIAGTADDTHSRARHSKPNKYINLLAVNDYTRVTALTPAGVQSDTINLVNIVAQKYQGASGNLTNGNLIVRLLGQYIPTAEIFLPDDTEPDVNDMLTDFCAWRSQQLGTPGNTALQLNNNAQLLSGRIFTSDGSTGVAGIGYIGSMCDQMYSCGVAQALLGVDDYFSADTLAHEIGHNLNAQHDDVMNTCAPGGFIMQAVACANCGFFASEFSSCSTTYFDDFLPTLTCLNNDPTASGARSIRSNG